MSDQTWKTALLILCAVAVGVLLVGGRFTGRALAQTEGASGGVICVVGADRNGKAPLFLVDVPDQTVMVYSYDYTNGRIQLTSVRSFRYDKRLDDWQGDQPTVAEVRAYVEQASQTQP